LKEHPSNDANAMNKQMEKQDNQSPINKEKQ